MTSRPPITPRARPALDGTSRSRVVGHYSQDGHTIVWAQGEIDIVTAPALMQELTVAVRVQPCRVVVDLTDVTFMDSTGINALVVARRRADIGSGELRLVAPCRLVRKVLRITGLDQILPVDSTIESPSARCRSSEAGTTSSASRWPISSQSSSTRLPAGSPCRIRRRPGPGSTSQTRGSPVPDLRLVVGARTHCGCVAHDDPRGPVDDVRVHRNRK